MDGFILVNTANLRRLVIGGRQVLLLVEDSVTDSTQVLGQYFRDTTPAGGFSANWGATRDYSSRNEEFTAPEAEVRKLAKEKRRKRDEWRKSVIRQIGEERSPDHRGHTVRVQGPSEVRNTRTVVAHGTYHGPKR
jgi:hypothetical protein